MMNDPIQTSASVSNGAASQVHAAPLQAPSAAGPVVGAPAWKAPLSMVWQKAEDDGGVEGEMTVLWSAKQQRITVGKEAFTHEGSPTTSCSSVVVRLLLAASAPSAAWRPVGSESEVRVAEFHAAIMEMFLDMAMHAHQRQLPPENIPSQIAEASEWLVTTETMQPFPATAHDAVAQLMVAMDETTLARLAPVFFDRRKVDKRGFDPAATVSLKFAVGDSFAGAEELQGLIATQLGRLREMATRPKDLSELSNNELVLRAFMQPDEATQLQARDEVIARLLRMDALGPQASQSMERQLVDMARLIAHLYHLVKPACRLCGRPATGFVPAPGGAIYGCDDHRGPAAKDLPSAEIVRAAAFIAGQAHQLRTA
jgi:hypothetical protein